MAFSKIKKIVTDVDGVLTDGKFLYDETGKKYKQFGPHDGDGIKLLKSVGIDIVGISADKRGFKITEKRLNDMGVEIYLVSEKERLDWFKANSIDGSTGFVGDGLFDIPVLRHTNFSFTPNNAPDLVKENANFVLKSIGGNGVFLEIALMILKENYEQTFLELKKGRYERNF